MPFFLFKSWQWIYRELEKSFLVCGLIIDIVIIDIDVNPLTRYSLRAKRIFRELNEEPFVVELDLRGIYLVRRLFCKTFTLLVTPNWLDHHFRWWVSYSGYSAWTGWSTYSPSSFCEWQTYWRLRWYVYVISDLIEKFSC